MVLVRRIDRINSSSTLNNTKLKPFTLPPHWGWLALCCVGLWPNASYAQIIKPEFFIGIERPFFTLSHAVLIVAVGLLLGQAKGKTLPPHIQYGCLFGSLLLGFGVAWFYRIPDLTLHTLILTTVIALWVMMNIKPFAIIRLILACIALCMMALDSYWHLSPAVQYLYSNILWGAFGNGLSIFAYVVCIRLFIAWFNKREWQDIAIRIMASWVVAVAVISLARELSEPVWVWVPVGT